MLGMFRRALGEHWRALGELLGAPGSTGKPFLPTFYDRSKGFKTLSQRHRALEKEAEEEEEEEEEGEEEKRILGESCLGAVMIARPIAPQAGLRRAHAPLRCVAPRKHARSSAAGLS